MSELAAINLSVVLVLIGLALHRSVERFRLRQFLADVTLPAHERDAAAHLAGVIAARGAAPVDPPFLLTLFRPLGPTPGAVLRRGGCCSGSSRLYILCLAELGIRAHQITLYAEDGLAQHCLVEVLLDDGPLIADPVYGMRYVDADRRPIGLEALQMGIPVSFSPLPVGGQSCYPSDPYYRFDFEQTKTANWTKSWARRTVYRALRLTGRRRADRLRVPALLEWPQVLLGAGLLSGWLIAGLFMFMVRGVA